MRRSAWIDAIKSHQNIKIDRDYFYICHRHFESDCFDQKPGRTQKLLLNKKAIPTIFDRIEVVEDEFHDESNCQTDIETVESHDRGAIGCSDSDSQIDHLKSEINKLNLRYNMDKEIWDLKMQSLSAKCTKYSSMNKDLKIQISDKEKKIRELVVTIEKLKKKSANSESSLEVIV